MGVVYKIGFRDCDEFYIGSCQDFMCRKRHHKSCCYNPKVKEYNYKIYKFIRDNYEWKDVIIEILEEYDNVVDNLELRKQEQLFMDELKPTLNKMNAYRSKEDRQEYLKKYNEEHKEEQKKYRAENKEKIYEGQKKWSEKNRDKITAQRKKHKEENPEKYEYRKERLICDCGGDYLYTHKSRHVKTKQHQDYLANLNNEN